MSVLFGDLLSHSYNITFSMFLDLVSVGSPFKTSQCQVKWGLRYIIAKILERSSTALTYPYVTLYELYEEWVRGGQWSRLGVNVDSLALDNKGC